MDTVGNSFEFSTIEYFLKTKGYFVYTVKGTSMMPLLRQKKDVVMLKSKGEERCKKYDVVLYRTYDRHKFILHRVLKVRPNDYVIAGDNNTFLEVGVTDQMIIGVMTGIRRNGKDISMDNKLYKLYVHLWCDCYPVRMWIIRTKRRIVALASGLKHKFKPNDESLQSPPSDP